MLDSLITSQTRIKLLLKFFINSSTRAHLRGLESEFGDSTNGIRVELNRLEDARLLKSTKVGNRKYYQANVEHPLFEDIHNLVIKEAGIDKIIERVISRTGNISGIYLTGSLAKGIVDRVIDIIIVGENIDKTYLRKKLVQAENISGRKIRCRTMTPGEADKELHGKRVEDLLVLWSEG